MNHFEEIVNNGVKNNKWQQGGSYSPNLCLDKYVGDIVSCDSGFQFIGDDFKYENIGKALQPSLIIILESPHIDEFDNDKREIGPAHGKTGSNIRNLFHCATRKILVKSGIKYRLILINAVQYQCSLGLGSRANLSQKDDVFDSCWEHKFIGRSDFLNRLNPFISIESDKSIIINCCTKSSNKSKAERKQKVSEAIREVVGSKTFYELSHPSAWRDFGFSEKSK